MERQVGMYVEYMRKFRAQYFAWQVPQIYAKLPVLKPVNLSSLILVILVNTQYPRKVFVLISSGFWACVVIPSPSVPPEAHRDTSVSGFNHVEK
jgi:hypothetical protein